MSIFVIVVAFFSALVLLALFSFLPMMLWEREKQSDYPEYHKSS